MKKRLTISLIVFFITTFISLIAYPQVEKNYSKEKREDLKLEVRSGSPPVLEFIVGKVKDALGVQFDFDYDGKYELTLPVKDHGPSTVFRGTPYRKPGLYRFRVKIIYSDKTSIFSYRIGFVDFVWGRDNFNFANDGEFENRIPFVSDTLINWAEENFGKLTDSQKMVLLWIMYRIYKGSIGRCYGFSGGEVLFLEHPELIPQPYLCTYDVPEWNKKIIKQMDYLQNEVVFSNFVNGRIKLVEKQTPEKTFGELEKIISSIIRGKPIVMGYQSNDMHHSMAIYGFWVRENDNKTVLLAANNWERNQENNIFSEDAENIVFIPPSKPGETYDISWVDLGKNKIRKPRVIFAINIDKEYRISESDFFKMLKNEQKWLIEHDTAVIIVEKTQDAYFIEKKDYKKTGYLRRKIYNDLPFVGFKKIDYNYIFEVNLKKLESFEEDSKNVFMVIYRKRYNSELRHYKDVNIFVVYPLNGVLKTQIMKPFEMDPYAKVQFTFSKEGLQIVEP